MGQVIELNKEFRKALNILENSSKNVFITGKAGTGKSTLLDYFRGKTKKKIVVLAPTGVAAVNIRGETIHSFFHFKPNTTLNKIKKIRYPKMFAIYRKIDAVIIDEISMVRADLLDCVDKFLRLNGKDHSLPFGGIQMVFIGDLYQLPPVVLSKEKEAFNTYYKSFYFFDADVFKEFSMEFIELQKVYRQKDKEFIHLLNAIRNNTVEDDDLRVLNQRVKPELNINELDSYIYLTSINRLAAEINNTQLKRIKEKQYVYKGKIEGEFNKKRLPADEKLSLKKGAQVMLLNNDSTGRWVNGTIAKVVGIKKDKSDNYAICVQLPLGNIEEVTPYKWQLFHYQFNVRSKTIETRNVGYFIQYPLKLAWAITIHKSQGKTFDKVVVDISGGIFAYGQVYVALSRCRSLEGIILKKAIEKKHIFMDWKIVDFFTNYQYKLSERNLPLAEKIKIIQRAIDKKNILRITYLKSNDEKSERVIRPIKTGEMTYSDKTFIGVEAFCYKRQDRRVFRVDRILELN